MVPTYGIVHCAPNSIYPFSPTPPRVNLLSLQSAPLPPLNPSALPLLVRLPATDPCIRRPCLSQPRVEELRGRPASGARAGAPRGASSVGGASPRGAGQGTRQGAPSGAGRGRRQSGSRGVNGISPGPPVRQGAPYEHSFSSVFLHVNTS